MNETLFVIMKLILVFIGAAIFLFLFWHFRLWFVNYIFKKLGWHHEN